MRDVAYKDSCEHVGQGPIWADGSIVLNGDVLLIFQSCHEETGGELEQEAAVCAGDYTEKCSSVSQESHIVNLNLLRSLLRLFVIPRISSSLFRCFFIFAKAVIQRRGNVEHAEEAGAANENYEASESPEVAHIGVEEASNAWASHESNTWGSFSEPDEFLSVLWELQRYYRIA